MTRINPFYGGRAGMLPDHMLGKNYDIVKAVYNNLDLLKEFMSDPNAEYIKENFDEIKDVLAIGPDISDVAKNIDEILKAKNYASSAAGSSKSAKDWATKLDSPVEDDLYSSKYYADFAKTENAKAEKLNETISEVKEDIEVINDNISSIKVTAENIDSITTVGNDISLSTGSIPIPDMGMVGNEDPDFSGSSILISLIANYSIYKQIYLNLDNLIKLSNELNEIPSAEEVNAILKECDESLDAISEVQKSVEKDLQEASKLLDQVSVEKAAAIKAIQEEVQKQTEILNSSIEDIEKYLEQAAKYTSECEGYRDECILALNKIKEQQIMIAELIKKEFDKALEEYLAKLDKAATDAVTEATQAILDNIEPIKDLVLQDFRDAAEDIGQQVKVAIQKAGQVAVNELLDTSTKEQEKLKEQGDQVISDATKQADRAEDEANRAQEIVDTLGRPDWNINEPDTPGFIKNKPEIYTKDELDQKISTVFKYKGSVANQASLPQEGNQVGDTYNVLDTGMNYTWDGSAWDPLATINDFSLFVKYAVFDGTRKTIQLNNYDSISGISTTGDGANLIMMSRWDKVDIGSAKYPSNLNAKDGTITINDKEIVATLSNLDKLKEEVLSKLQIVTSEDKPLEDSITEDKLYGFNSDSNFNSPSSEVNSIIVAENLDSESLSHIPNGTAIAVKQLDLL